MRPVNRASPRFISASAYELQIEEQCGQLDAAEKTQKVDVGMEKAIFRLSEENAFLKFEIKHLTDELNNMKAKHERSVYLEEELRIAQMRMEDMRLYISRKEVRPSKPEVERIDAESIRCSLPDGEYDVRISIDGTKLRVRPKVGGYGTCNDGVFFISKLGTVSEFHGVMALSYIPLKEGAIEINLEDSIDSSTDVLQGGAVTRMNAVVGTSKEE